MFFKNFIYLITTSFRSKANGDGFLVYPENDEVEISIRPEISVLSFPFLFLFSIIKTIILVIKFMSAAILEISNINHNENIT